MATYREDIVTGSRCAFTEDGYVQRRRIKMFGTSVFSLFSKDTVGWRAIQQLAQDKQITYGSAHPSIPGLYVTSIEATPVANSKNQIVFDIGYSDLSIISVSIDGTVVREMTQFEADGTPNTVLYLPNQKKRPAKGFYPEKGQRYCESSGLVPVEVLRPGMILEFERWKVAKGPLSGDLAFLEGATNASEWQKRKAETWVCTGVSPRGTLSVDKHGQLIQRTTIWRERLTFQYRGFATSLGAPNNSWRQLLVYTDHRTGQSPPDIDPKADGYEPNKTMRGNGWREIIPQPFADFDLFKLPTIFADAKKK